mmetsp:Transcript_22252/g.52600  ORF Transcript_22252/g.52600 Transcript_22252/m.52600 type:complete len:116 (+) Transcript_22252:133-480(+)
MNAPPPTPIPDALASALKEWRLVVSIGSGFTRVAGLPSWSELFDGVCSLGISQATAGSGSHDDMDRLQFEIVEQGGKEQVCQCMEKMLCWRGDENSPGRAFRATDRGSHFMELGL